MLSNRYLTLISQELEPDMKVQHQGGMSWMKRPWLRENPVLRRAYNSMSAEEKKAHNDKINKKYKL